MSVSSSYILGSDPYSVSTTQEHALGTRATFQIKDSSGDPAFCEAVYCKSLATLSANYLTEIPLVGGTDAFQIDTHVTTTVATTINTGGSVGQRFCAGIPLVASVSGDYLWVVVKGFVPVFVGLSCVRGDLLYTTATAGLVDNTATAGLVEGLAPLATVGGSNAVTDCYAYQDIAVRRAS